LFTGVNESNTVEISAKLDEICLNGLAASENVLKRTLTLR